MSNNPKKKEPAKLAFTEQGRWKRQSGRLNSLKQSSATVESSHAILLTALSFTGTPIEYEPYGTALVPLNDPDYFDEEMFDLEDEEEE
jgi:hypothetical protein